VRAYRFALDPSGAPVLGLRRITGAARLADNRLLRRVSAVKAQRAAGAGYGVAGADLTPGQGWSLPDLRRAWNEIRQWVAPCGAASDGWRRHRRPDDCTACGRSPDRDVNAARNRGALVRHVDLELPGDASGGPENRTWSLPKTRQTRQTRTHRRGGGPRSVKTLRGPTPPGNRRLPITNSLKFTER
jgi:hypothetical protein